MHASSEYDAFGPWIDKVRSVDDLPRLYRGAGIDPAGCRLVLKVPRDIVRREANASMHLYDHLLVVGSDSLTVLSRRGRTGPTKASATHAGPAQAGRTRTGSTHDGYVRVEVPFDQIVAFEDSTVLLDGRLTVHTVAGWSIVIPYNGSANAAILELVALLRQLYLPTRLGQGAVGVDPQTGQYWAGLGVEDIGLVTAFRSLARREPLMRMVGAVSRRVAVQQGYGLKQLIRRVWPVTLHGSITVTDDQEIQWIHRRDWITSGSGAIDSLARTIVPLCRISGVQAGPHPGYRGLTMVLVYAGASCLRFPVPAGPETDAFLANVVAYRPA